MQKFNLGKFNVKSTKANESGGYINAVSSASAFTNTNYSISGTIEADGLIDTVLGVKIMQSIVKTIEAVGSLTGKTRRFVNTELENINGVSSLTVQPASVFGEQFIALSDIILKAGQTVVIDTDKMTVLLDGQNAINLISDDSEFFLLLQGEDVITYSDSNSNRNVNIKVEWKDRWL